MLAMPKMRSAIGDLWRSVSRFVVVASAENRRVDLFQQAVAKLKLPPIHLVTYQQLLDGEVRLADCLQAGDVLRIESAGKSAETTRLFLQNGASLLDQSDAFSDPNALEKGLLYSTRQWYLGFCAALDLIDAQRQHAPPHRIMNDTPAIRTLFDKRMTQAHLHAAKLPIPPPLPPIECYDQLRAEMERHDMRRVFVKLAHGSSASGAVAFETHGRQQQATTTVEVDGAGRLFNSRQIRKVRDSAEIRTLIDTLCRQHVHVERWLPKATLQGQTFDVRVLIIGGKARHSIVRLSRSPFTNLHLLNDRAPIETLVAHIGAARWQAAQVTCERAAACFPDAFYVGVDLMFTANLRHYVLELNGFGDLLPTVWLDGRDSYAAEIQAFRHLFDGSLD